MSMIECKECKKSISSSAYSCPNCGYKDKNINPFLGVSFILIFCVFICFGSINYQGEKAKIDRERSIKENKERIEKLLNEQRRLREAGTEDSVINLDGPGYSGDDKAAAHLGDRPGLKPQIVMRPPEVMGPLTKEQIERVVLTHHSELKFCYEQALQKNPELAGSIRIKFTISGTGSVMSALVLETSMKSPAVERCMTGKIQRWAFPEFKGGGIVIVHYPFEWGSLDR